MISRTDLSLKAIQAYKGNFFKFSTLAILVILLLLQLANAHFNRRIVPDIVSLSVAFFCVFYLWMAESKDIKELKDANLALLNAQQELKESHIDTILSLVLSQEAKDSYTYGHSERVRQYSVSIAQAMKLSKKEMDIISRAAKLHDIGKIGIRDEVLFSERKLTSRERDIVQSHPAKGISILEPLKFLEEEKKIVRHHHERFDGKGYPDGLRGEQIPLGARIVCAADAFDAMRSQRPYNDPFNKKQIIQELKDNIGIQFDPKVVNAFLSVIDSFYV